TSNVRADEDIYPVAILPKMSDLHEVADAWLAQSVNHVLADRGGKSLALLYLLSPLLLILLLGGHSYSRSCWGARSLSILSLTSRVRTLLAASHRAPGGCSDALGALAGSCLRALRPRRSLAGRTTRGA